MTKKEHEINNIRQPYRKPQIEEVKMIAEEAVLVNCKVGSTTSGPGGWKGMCSNPGGGQACNILGS